MNTFVVRLQELVRPAQGAAPRDPVHTLAIDLAIGAIGLAVFGFAIATTGGVGWRFVVAAKISGAFLAAFLLCLAPLYALSRFFSVEAPFASIVAAFARHLAVGGIFAAAGAGVFALLRRGEARFDGWLAITFVVLVIIGALARRAKGAEARWLPPFPAFLAVVLFFSLLGQSAWAFRPYMDPNGPTLFAARAEWLTGRDRAWLERRILDAAPRPAPPPAASVEPSASPLE